MTTYDYDIDIEQLPSPIGRELRFVAKLAYLYRDCDGHRQKLAPGVSESWGTTPEEARAKLESRLQTWLGTLN